MATGSASSLASSRHQPFFDTRLQPCRDEGGQTRYLLGENAEITGHARASRYHRPVK